MGRSVDRCLFADWSHHPHQDLRFPSSYRILLVSPRTNEFLENQVGLFPMFYCPKAGLSATYRTMRFDRSKLPETQPFPLTPIIPNQSLTRSTAFASYRRFGLT